MNEFLKLVFRPVGNRNYTNKKMSALVYFLYYFFLPVLISIYGAIKIDSAWWYVAAGIVVFAIISHMLVGESDDKFWWDKIWKRHYSNEKKPHTSEQHHMKQYEQNPTPENYAVLQNHLNKKSKSR